MNPGERKDLVVLVADADTEQAVSALLAERTPSLGIAPLRFDVHRHPQRDPGVYRRAHEFLRPVAREYRRALVVFDLEGCGREDSEPEEIEHEVEENLRRSGWEAGAAAAVVIAPELEAWLWGRTARAAQILSVSAEDLHDAIASFALSQSGKVERPKEALNHVLRELAPSRPRSSALLAAFARQMGRLDECQDRAFRKLLVTLRRWFGEGQ